MLSHNYRIKLEEICSRIKKGQNVELNEIIWAEKIAKSNHVASRMLRQARRKAANPDMQEGDLDSFLNDLDIGSPDPRDSRTGFDSVDEIVDWFRRDQDDDWRKRD